MMPPTLQKAAKYSDQFLNRDGIAMVAFFGKYLVRMGLMSSTKSVSGLICFDFKFFSGGTMSMLR